MEHAIQGVMLHFPSLLEISMKRVLLYENRKTGYTVLDFSTISKQKKAYKKLFEMLDQWEIFCDYTEENKKFEEPWLPEKSKEQENYEIGREFYSAAKRGNVEACRRLCLEVQHQEYGQWQIKDVE